MLSITDITCSHCTLPVPPGAFRDGEDEQFCCPGCRAVYQQIHSCGLEAYYRYRDSGDVAAQPAAELADTSSFDSASYAELYIRRSGALSSTDWVLEGVSCAACVWLVEKLPSRLEGLVEARLSLTDATLRLTWDADRLPLSRIANELQRFGYRPHPAKSIQQTDLFRRELRGRLVHLGIAGAISGNNMLIGAALYAGWFSGIEAEYELLLRWLSLILGVVCLAIPGREFFTGAMASLRMRSMNFDVPIAGALLAGGIAGVINVMIGRGEIYFDSLSALVFLLLVGRLIQFCQQRRARGALELMFSLMPSTCRVIRQGAAHPAPIQSLEVGDVVEVRSGELIPADGVVRRGSSTMDIALLTGESRPQAISTDSMVFGGACNVESTIEVVVSSTGSETRVGKLMQLVEKGLSDKPPIVRLADRVAAWFTIVVAVASVLTFVWWIPAGFEVAMETVVSLLIVTCPCVLGLSLPLTFAMSAGKLARQGILVKSAAVLERLTRGGTLLLDKTGTLTFGRMEVVAWEGDARWQSVVADLEKHATHPVGRALREAFGGDRPAPDVSDDLLAVRTLPGAGLIAERGGKTIEVGSTRMMRERGAFVPEPLARSATAMESAGHPLVFVAVDGVVQAIAALSDTVRPEAADIIASLRSRGFLPGVLSGDLSPIVDRVATSLGVARSAGGLTPEEKLAQVRDANAVMIGDGINDAAALAAADVGIAVCGGAEAALAAADVYIAKPGLHHVIDLVDTARHTMRIAWGNVWIATSYNVIAGMLAMTGHMHPLLAACVMPMSSATVISLTIAFIRRGPARRKS